MTTQKSTVELSDVRPATHEKTICPIEKTAEIISGKWTLLIIRDLTKLERSLCGISPKTLSERLTALENEDVLRRHAYAEVPPKVEYSLTEKGQALVEVIEAMRAYGKRWLCCDE
jgi:DNA-binding HxlR family transcriptional regulator